MSNRDEELAMDENKNFLGEKSKESSPENVGTWADWDKVNFFLAIFNLMNAILGSGILGLAYAVKSLGIVLYIAMLMMVAGLAFYAISLLLDMCELTGFKSYEEIAEKAGGAKGKLVAVCYINFLGYTSGFAMCCMIFCTVLIVLQSAGIPCPL